MMLGMDFETGVDRERIFEVGRFICSRLGRDTQSLKKDIRSGKLQKVYKGLFGE